MSVDIGTARPVALAAALIVGDRGGRGIGRRRRGYQRCRPAPHRCTEGPIHPLTTVSAMAQRHELATEPTGVTRYLVGLVILGVIFVVLAAQNSQPTTVDLIVWDATPPVYAVAFVSALIGAAVAAVGASLWRHRRRRHNREQVELDELRGARPADAPGPVDDTRTTT